MAKVTFGPGGVRRYSGAVGNAVYRRRGSETILAQRPERSNREPSEAQLAHRPRFGKAVDYGRRILRDPAKRAVYEEAARRSGLPIFSLMVRDYFRAPEVEEIDCPSTAARRVTPSQASAGSSPGSISST